MLRPTRVILDFAALKNNLEVLRKACGVDNFFCPMVKANAYGHGELPVARATEEFGVSALGVALVEEGLRLRAAGLRGRILVFAPLNPAGASAMFTHQLTPVLTRFEDLEALTQVGSKTPMTVHVKFNTGMGRLGFDTSELARLKTELAKHPQLRIEGTCTHLTHGDEADQDDSFSARQLHRFLQMSEGFPGLRHAHKSASLATRKKASDIGARPGISLYGLPYEGQKTMAGLKPVLTWKSALARVHTIEKGEFVGYGSNWRANRKSTIGVIPLGYGDGYLRALSGPSGKAGGEMLFRGGRVPVVGNVCMDYVFLDLTDKLQDGTAQAGEEIVILGKQGENEVTAGLLAERAGTIAYEIVTAISARVTREDE